MTEKEIWKDINGYEGYYKVSNKGNIFSVERKDTRGQKRGGRMLKQSLHKNGHFLVGLNKGGKSTSKWVHRLVAEAFIPNPNNYPEINYKDENRANNNMNNLEWCTSKYNANVGSRKEKISKKLSKKVRAVNIETGEVLAFTSTMDAEKKGFNSGGVAAACKGIYKGSNGKLIGDGRTYKGYRWYYEEEEEK